MRARRIRAVPTTRARPWSASPAGRSGSPTSCRIGFPVGDSVEAFARARALEGSMKVAITFVKIRLDRLLVERGLAPTREKAQAMILAGLVTVGGRRADKAGEAVPSGRRSRSRRAAAPLRVARRREARRGARRTSESIPRGTSASTSAPRPEASPTASCSAARRASMRSTWATASSTRSFETMPAWSCARRSTRASFRRPRSESRSSSPPSTSPSSPCDSCCRRSCGFSSRARSLVALVKPQFEAGRSEVPRGGVVRSEETRRRVVAGDRSGGTRARPRGPRLDSVADPGRARQRGVSARISCKLSFP